MKRPFLPAKARVKQCFEAALYDAVVRIGHTLEGDTARVARALVTGGSVAAAAAMMSSGPLQGLQRSLDKAKAAAVIKVFSLAMLSRWLVREQPPPQSAQEIRRRRECWATVILELLGDFSPEGVSHFLDTDVQYLYELTGRAEGQICTVGAIMLWVDSIAELTGHAPIKGARGGFPFENLYDLGTRSGVSVDFKVIPSDFAEVVGLDAILRKAWETTQDCLQEGKGDAANL